MKSRYIFSPPDRRAYSTIEIWTADGKAALGLWTLLFKLKIISLKHFEYDQ